MADSLDEMLPPVGPGHNLPPTPIDPVEIQAALGEAQRALIERALRVLDQDTRLPLVCEDETTDEKFSDAIKTCLTLLKNIEAARVSAKEPYLTAERAVDGFFAKISKPVEIIKAKMGRIQTAYKIKVADEEKRRREEIAREERRKAAELERQAREAAAAARKSRDDAEALARANAARDAADAAAAEAARARKDSLAKPADMSRSRTDLGAVSSLKTTYDFEVEHAELVPRVYLEVSKPAIKAAIKAATTRDGKCDLKIAGVKIYPVRDSVTR